MIISEKFQSIIGYLFCRQESQLLQAETIFNDPDAPFTNRLNAAFLISLSGDWNPYFRKAKDLLQGKQTDASLRELASFLLTCLDVIEGEIASACQDPEFNEALEDLDNYLENSPVPEDPQFADKLMQVFFPEGVGVFSAHQHKADELRKLREVAIIEPNPDPISNPGREMLFTSNVLLGIPNENTDIDSLNYNEAFRNTLKEVIKEPQKYWYDHPIQIGVDPGANEILYGLKQLDRSMDIERERGKLGNGKVKCLLSVSVTHEGLHEIAREYIRLELEQHAELRNLEVYVFTENDTQSLIREVLIPGMQGGKIPDEAEELLQVFGVDGEYGRHYSFLKAIVAVWNVLIDPGIRATFKMDLDQVFPQQELIEQSGASALEHFKTPLWGATGRGNEGEELELGMIAGALVNEKDIHKGLFTPDVPFPESIPDRESYIFFSKMLMALSTEGELMTRYNPDSGIDGVTKCIERIHVTGGTNGIRVEALRKHRPFTPGFIGRAEDQCYILSVLGQQKSSRLAYLHEDGLIMRHDKEAFAQEALEAAKFGNIVGDYIRTIYFSEYARTLGSDQRLIKKLVNPFTGCFISRIPVTVCLLRYALRGQSFSEEGKQELADRFFLENAGRLKTAIQFTSGEESPLKKQVSKERQGWDLFYDTLDSLEKKLKVKDTPGLTLAKAAGAIINSCRI